MRPRAARRAAPARRRRAAPSRRRRCALPENGLRPQDPERAAAVLVVGAVDDQHAVEMVVLVLDDAGTEPLELPAHLAAVEVPPLEADARRAGHGDADALQREAALLLGLALDALLDHEPRV